jgi:hypothetical protein
MIIYFERSGGFMGRSVSTTVDTNRIEPERALSLLEKIEDADFFDLPKSPGASIEGFQGADDFCYKVTVEVAGVQHTVETSENNAPEELQPLLQELSRLARESSQQPSEMLAGRSGGR